MFCSMAALCMLSINGIDVCAMRGSRGPSYGLHTGNAWNGEDGLG